MRRFFLVSAAVYGVVVVACLLYTFHDDGGMYSSPALLGLILGEPWIMLLGPLLGDHMSYPDKLNSAIDDDQWSVVGMATIGISGMINACILYGVSRLIKKFS